MGLIRAKLPPRDSIQACAPPSHSCRLTGIAGQRDADSSPVLSESLALQTDVSMLHLEHMLYFVILMILKGTQFGSMAWSGGVRASPRGSALCGGMLHLFC